MSWLTKLRRCAKVLGEPKMIPHARGKIAMNARWVPGIITGDLMKYDDIGGSGYLGVSLIDGVPWHSANPVVLGTFEEFLASGMTFPEWAKKRSGT